MIFPTYGNTPGGRRDTYTTSRMRSALRPRDLHADGAEVWASMPISARLELVLHACGTTRCDLHLKAWADIDARQRLLIGTAARKRAECLL